MHIRILITTRKNAVTVPPVALQRGPDGFYVWVIKPDNTVEQRPIEALTVSDSSAIVTKGLSPANMSSSTDSRDWTWERTLSSSRGPSLQQQSADKS